MDEKMQRMQRRSFECWRIYSERKLSQRRATQKAVYSYSVRLEQKVINSLLRNCIEAKETRSIYESQSTESSETRTAVAEFNRKSILKKIYQAWLEHWKNRRRRKALNAKICGFRNELYLNKYIEAWKINCLEKKENAELDKKASKFYRDFLQRRSLRLWIDRHNDNLIEIKKWDDATLHSHRKLLRKIWFAWIRYSNVKIEKANRIADARYFHESQLLRKSLRKLASNVTTRIAERAMLERATNRYAKILLRRVLRGWIDYHRRAIDLDRKIETRRKRLENSLKEKILWQLRLYVWKKKCSRRRNYTLTNNYNRKVTERAILVLKNYLLYRKKKAIRLLYLNNGVARISYEMEKVYIGRWRIAVICHAQERQKIRRVEDHSSARSMKIYFSIWKKYSERYKIEARRKNKLREIGETVLSNKYMTLWMKKYEAVAVMHEKENSAMSIFEEKLKTRFLNYWKRYIDEKNRKKMVIDEAKIFHRKHLLREGLKKALKICLYESESRYENRFKTLKTNCFEDFEITRKFFGKWWRALTHANENGKTKSSNGRIEERGDAFEIPYETRLTHRLVIPEYMRRSNSNFHDNRGFHQRTHFSSRKTFSPSESSPYGSYNSTNSSSETCNITEPL